MIGQSVLQESFNKFILDTLPKAIMLIGEFGCGKHTLVTEVSKNLNMNVVDLSTTFDSDVISHSFELVEPTIYIISGDTITEKQEGVLLKTLEEPPKFAFFFVLTLDENSVLPTIKNRCFLYKFKQYSIEELEQFAEDKQDLTFYTIANTPGKVLKYKNCDLTFVIDLCYKILDKVRIASFSNVLNITNKLNFKTNDADKIEIELLLDCLRYCASDRLKTSFTQEDVEKYFLTRDLIYDLHSIFNIDKAKRFEYYLYQLKVLQ